MLVIDAELLFGTIRAGSADDLSATGAVDEGEWPPSPARIFSALVAADGTGANRKVSSGRGLQAIEQARPPRILCDDNADVLRSQLRPRFVVKDKTFNGGNVQEYPARTADEVRLGSRLSLRSPRISYVWDDLELSEEEIDDISLRSARVGYLGCADSPARLRVRTTDNESGARAWEIHDDGENPLPIPYPGFLSDLDDLYSRFSAGAWVRRSWLRPVRATYRSPSSRPETIPSSGLISIWLRFDRSIAGRHALLITEALRASTLSLYDQHVLGGTGEIPSVLCGHGFDEAEWQQTLFVVLPHVGQAHADGRIHGAAVSVPDSSPEVAGLIRRALGHLDRLNLPGGRSVGVSFHGGEQKPIASAPWRWSRPSSRFVSALPVVHERFRKGGPNLEDAKQWCRHAGLPEPVNFRSMSSPLLPGAPRLLPHEVYRSGRERRPFSHVEIEFAEPVIGPVVLGQSRTFGLGLMAPMDRKDRS